MNVIAEQVEFRDPNGATYRVLGVDGYATLSRLDGLGDRMLGAIVAEDVFDVTGAFKKFEIRADGAESVLYLFEVHGPRGDQYKDVEPELLGQVIPAAA